MLQRIDLREKMNSTKKKQLLTYISFSFLMIALGASDAMRGIFAPIFQHHFELSNLDLSTIIIVSYAGNLLFLLCGGVLADRFEKNKVVCMTMLLWAAAILLYLMTDNYYCLLLGMFITMGASTLMNTLINIMTPTVFITSPIFIINTLFFVQGIGTTGSQKIIGSHVTDFTGWKNSNLVLLIIAGLGMIFFLLNQNTGNIKKVETSPKSMNKLRNIVKNKVFLSYFFILGFYFVAEHGILNWFVTYTTQKFSMSMNDAATYLAIFFGGMTLGRLIFAAIVQRLGAKKSVYLFGGAGTICYTCGVFFGEQAVILISIAGLFLSILYPTLIMLIQDYYEPASVATATGFIISSATVFDIIFNRVFGKLADTIGLSAGFYLLSICMILFYISFLIFCNNQKANNARNN